MISFVPDASKYVYTDKLQIQKQNMSYSAHKSFVYSEKNAISDYVIIFIAHPS